MNGNVLRVVKRTIKERRSQKARVPNESLLTAVRNVARQSGDL